MRSVASTTRAIGMPALRNPRPLGEDPLGSRFEPRSELLMVRAPQARFIIERHFSGEVLDAGEPVVLTLNPRDWPDSEEYCDIPWEELDARLSSKEPP